TLQSSTVSVCAGLKCGAPAGLAGAADGVPNVLVSRSYATTGQVLAWTPAQLHRSTDGGKTFKPVTLPAKAAVQALAEDGDGALYLSLLTTDAKGNATGGLFVSRDGGASWPQLGKDTPLAKGSTPAAPLGHHRLTDAAGRR